MGAEASADDAPAAFDWQPQVGDGELQQAPVAAFGVGSPQHGDAAGAPAESARAAGAVVAAAGAPQQADLGVSGVAIGEWVIGGCLVGGKEGWLLH